MRRRGFLALIGLGAAGAAGGVIPAAAKASPVVAAARPEFIAPTVINGSLIVSGSITARQIAVGSICAAKIKDLHIAGGMS